MLRPAIFSYSNDTIVDLNGESSIFGKGSLGCDIDYLDDIELNIFLSSIHQKLIQIDNFKAYLFKDKTFLNTFGDTGLIKDSLSLKEFIPLDSKILFKDDYLVYEQSYFRFFKINSIPPEVYPAFFESLLCSHSFIALSAPKVDKDASLLDLEKKRRFLYSNYLNPFKDPDIDQDLEDSKAMLSHLKNDETTIYKTSLILAIKGKSLEEINDKGFFIKKRAKTKGLKLSIVLKPNMNFINQIFPGIKPLAKINKDPIKLTSQCLTNLLCSKDVSLHDKGVSLSSTCKSSISFNPFNPNSQNFNMVICGPSGRGKSVLANKIASDLLNQGVKVSIIDKGGSFKKLSMLYANHKNFLGTLDLDEHNLRDRKAKILDHTGNFRHVVGEKLLILDESWELLRECGDYIEEMFRTFRKENASILAITQSLEDFEKSDIGRVILDNSFHKFLFSQKVDSSKYLDDFSRDVLKAVGGIKGEYSEFLYLCEERVKTLRFYQDDLEKLLFNSEPKENERFYRYVEDHKNYFSFKGICERYLGIPKC